MYEDKAFSLEELGCNYDETSTSNHMWFISPGLPGGLFWESLPTINGYPSPNISQ